MNVLEHIAFIMAREDKIRWILAYITVIITLIILVPFYKLKSMVKKIWQ